MHISHLSNNLRTYARTQRLARTLMPPRSPKLAVLNVGAREGCQNDPLHDWSLATCSSLGSYLRTMTHRIHYDQILVQLRSHREALHGFLHLIQFTGCPKTTTFKSFYSRKFPTCTVVASANDPYRLTQRKATHILPLYIRGIYSRNETLPAREK